MLSGWGKGGGSTLTISLALKYIPREAEKPPEQTCFLLWVFQRPLSPSFVLVKGATVATRHTAFTIIINMARQRSDVLEAFFLTASSTLQSITGDICLLLHFHKLQEQFITTAQG